MFDVDLWCDADTLRRTNLSCSSLSTIYVTVPASPTTKTIYNIGHGSSTKDSAEFLASATVNVTKFLATTQAVSVLEASHTSETQNEGPYSFIVNDGKITWLAGKIPPSSTTFDIVTSYITTRPAPVTATIKNLKSALCQEGLDLPFFQAYHTRLY